MRLKAHDKQRNRDLHAFGYVAWLASNAEKFPEYEELFPEKGDEEEDDPLDDEELDQQIEAKGLKRRDR